MFPDLTIHASLSSARTQISFGLSILVKKRFGFGLAFSGPFDFGRIFLFFESSNFADSQLSLACPSPCSVIDFPFATWSVSLLASGSPLPAFLPFSAVLPLPPSATSSERSPSYGSPPAGASKNRYANIFPLIRPPPPPEKLSLPTPPVGVLVCCFVVG